MTSETITLEFIARQLDQALVELGSMRDDMRVLTAMTLRVDNTLNRLLNEVHEMHVQHARFGDRLRKLEGWRTEP